METEPKIVFENIGPSDAVRQRILDEIAHLEDFYGRITACRVVIDKPEKGKRKGTPFQVRIHLVLPGGKEVAVRPSTAGHQWNEDPMVAIRTAFDAAQKQLKKNVKRLRGAVKTHDVPQDFGNIVRIFPDDGYGFIEAPDGQEIYFHKNSVLRNAFPRLTVGTMVRFEIEDGQKGPQASTVEVTRHR